MRLHSLVWLCARWQKADCGWHLGSLLDRWPGRGPDQVAAGRLCHKHHLALVQMERVPVAGSEGYARRSGGNETAMERTWAESQARASTELGRMTKECCR
jgi:hypothetical protein